MDIFTDTEQQYLMCKNTVVLDLQTYEILNEELLPGVLRFYTEEGFIWWMRNRYSCDSNVSARLILGRLYSRGRRRAANVDTKQLSLSDCYWVYTQKGQDFRPERFEDISPYYTSYWATEDSRYEKGFTRPTLYTNGYRNKEWINTDILEKTGSDLTVEYDCYRLCKALDIPCNVVAITDGGVRVSNFTDTNYFLETAEQSGRINPEDFDYTDIIKHFGKDGVDMILVDCIIGNGDRHAGNFGWLRSTSTGDYVGMSPLYDFDHALDTKDSTVLMLDDIIDLCQEYAEYKDHVLQRIDKLKTSVDIHSTFLARADNIKQRLSVGAR